jgi:hypothetical protein
MKRKLIFRSLAWCAAIAVPSAAWAVPTLQIGAAADNLDPFGDPIVEGIYEDYQPNPDPPPVESDTAITFGDTLYVGGVFGPNTVSLGGSAAPNDWSSFDSNYSIFDTHDSILIVSVSISNADLGTLLANLTVDGNTAFNSSAYPPNLFPNNHAPLLVASHYLYFDIGDFLNNSTVPDFASETGAAAGSIKTLTLAGFDTSVLDWAHFDVMAIETNQTGGRNIRTSWDVENNPGGHDVTWKPEGGEPPSEVPVPGTLLLLGLGLVGLARSRSARVRA